MVVAGRFVPCVLMVGNSVPSSLGSSFQSEHHMPYLTLAAKALTHESLEMYVE